jgi:predicted dehydrogenase
MSTPFKVAIVGCGNISGIYLKNLQRFPWLQVVAVSDLKPELVQKALEAVPGAKALSIDEIVKSPEISIVINLTPPQAHFPVSLQFLQAGKSVYSEKPAAGLFSEAQKLLSTAKEKNVIFGCAPDTFLGGGIQTSRKLIEDGWIGKPLGFSGAMLCRGPESWHPNPDFFYKAGAGPLYDMGPYYLTTFVNLFGPIEEVVSFNKKGFSQRLATCKEKFGTLINVEIPTHYVSTLRFKSEVIGGLTTSFDVVGTKTPNIEVHGTEGSLIVPDPNTFGGPIFFKSAKGGDWKEVPLTHPYSENSRGLGVADLALALEQKRPARGSGDLAIHVLESIEAIHLASDQKRAVKITTPCD